MKPCRGNTFDEIDANSTADTVPENGIVVATFQDSASHPVLEARCAEAFSGGDLDSDSVAQVVVG